MTIRYEIMLAEIDLELWPNELGVAVANEASLVRQIQEGRKPRAPMVGRIRAYIATERDRRGLAHVAPEDARSTLIRRFPSRFISVANNN